MAIEIPRYLQGAELLIAHKEAAGTRYTPPNPDHYPHGYLWDSGFHAIVYARSGRPDLARKELEEVFSWQAPSGFIPNMKFGDGRNWDFERRFVFGIESKTSKYSQPPVLAWAAFETYSSFIQKGQEETANHFLSNNFAHLKAFYRFFMNERENENNPLIKVVHPHETGRDSDPTFDFVKWGRIPRNSVSGIIKPVVDKANTATNYLSTIAYGRNLNKNGWDANLFGVNDVMFNCIYAEGLSYLSKISGILGDYEDTSFYREKAEEVGNAIVQEMWDNQDQMFYAQRHRKPIRVVSISNLFPLMLPEIQPFQVERLLDLIEDPEWFGTRYLMPSTPVNSVHFNPALSEWSLWRGGTWVPTNVVIERGIRTRSIKFKEKDPKLYERGMTVASRIRRQTKEMVDMSGSRECFNPLTGKGLRKEVKTFGMSAASGVMEF